MVRFPSRNGVPACFQSQAVGGGSRDPTTHRGALGGSRALDAFGQLRRE